MGKGSSYEVVRHENHEVFIFELSFEWSRDDHTTGMVV
jgi:hypothetical protein